MTYYPEYEPKNAQHFRDMLDQFRKAPDLYAMESIEVLWVLSPDVDRQDILVAHGRVIRERGWQQ